MTSTAREHPRTAIGPNAIAQLAHAVAAADGESAERGLLLRAGLGRYVGAMPERMVDECDVATLHRVLRQAYPEEDARRLLRDAGRRTGDYLLAHRIPRPVQRLLMSLPAPWSARLLVEAIREHAWTFAGSGRFDARAVDSKLEGPWRLRWQLTIAGNPLCRGLPDRAEPACDYYAATFERLFSALVHRHATVIETDCEACGANACCFAVRWP